MLKEVNEGSYGLLHQSLYI